MQTHCVCTCRVHLCCCATGKARLWDLERKKSVRCFLPSEGAAWCTCSKPYYSLHSRDSPFLFHASTLSLRSPGTCETEHTCKRLILQREHSLPSAPLPSRPNVRIPRFQERRTRKFQVYVMGRMRLAPCAITSHRLAAFHPGPPHPFPYSHRTYPRNDLACHPHLETSQLGSHTHSLSCHTHIRAPRRPPARPPADGRPGGHELQHHSGRLRRAGSRRGYAKGRLQFCAAPRRCASLARHLCVRVRACACVRVRVRVRVCVYVCVCVCVCVWPLRISLCMATCCSSYVCMYACMHVCMYIMCVCVSM